MAFVASIDTTCSSRLLALLLWVTLSLSAGSAWSGR